LKGRSARAGAFGAADFFSGRGNAMLSSLAAAAGGGVTAEKLGHQNDRIGRVPKKQRLACNDKVRKQDADMRDCARRRGAAVATLC
jgi:hypothetical protein